MPVNEGVRRPQAEPYAFRAFQYSSWFRIAMEMEMYDSHANATRGKRVEGSGGRRKGGQESSRHHGRLGGVPQQEHLAQQSQSSIMRRDGKHESTCLGVMSATAHPRRGGELFFAPSQCRRRCRAAVMMIQVSSHATAHCLRVLSVSLRSSPPPPLLFLCPH